MVPTKNPAAGKKRRRQPAAAFSAARMNADGWHGAQAQALVDLEVEIDRLVCTTIGVGGLPDVVETLITARRLLYTNGRR